MTPIMSGFPPRTGSFPPHRRCTLPCLGIIAGFLCSAHPATFTFDVDADRVPPAIVRAGNGIKVTWPDWLDGRQGQLEHANSLAGPWQRISQTSPYQSDPPLAPQEFYRVHARPTTLHIPESYDPQTPIPLVLLLHAYTGGNVTGGQPSGQWEEQRLSLLPLAESRGFLYASLDGLRDSANWQFWAANEDCCDFNNVGVDDQDFLERVIEVICSAYNVDPKRIYLIGHSNGGLMVYEFAAQHSDLIAAAAALAPPVTVAALATPPAQPVHILHVQGTSDTLVPYEGGSNTVNFPIRPITLDYVGALGTIERWAQFNGCSNLVSDAGLSLDLLGGLAGNDTSVSRYQTCPPGGAVELWTVQGGDHFFMQPTTEFREGLIDWLLQHPKP